MVSLSFVSCTPPYQRFTPSTLELRGWRCGLRETRATQNLKSRSHTTCRILQNDPSLASGIDVFTECQNLCRVYFVKHLVKLEHLA